jgi:hypothetical protein
MLVRALTLALAILACAWFVLGIRQSHAISEATAIVSTGNSVTGEQAARADSLLNEAKVLNPDKTVEILRGELAARRGDNALADQYFLQVGREEPDNLDAWAWLGREAANKTELALAYIHLNMLAPPVGKSQ